MGQPVIRAYGGAVVPVLVFVAFRIFDIAKPWPASRLERLPNGWGILADDLAAAVYANLICQLLLRLAWPGMLFRG
jgi:phosphatidylglycerophosphatase A